ncbi:MAG: class I SAM-dependent methyltransferase [Candidatus Aminicenantes bacterium]|nr:class I SAM-dependent methyltransferase [Candidatus Aminicenantes bacterium]
MNNKFKFMRIMVLCFFLIPLAAYEIQNQKDVLKPDNTNEARLNRLQPPDQVMDAIGVKKGMVVAEIGAGQGRYVTQLAVRVGEKGKVYAEDIDAASLQYLEKRCERGGLKNVKTILGDVKDPKLPKGELDLIFIISAYHHFDDPVTLLKNARPALKTDGILAIGEWVSLDGSNSEYNTPLQMEAQMKEAGYTLDRIETFLEKNNMYIYVFRLGPERSS